MFPTVSKSTKKTIFSTFSAKFCLVYAVFITLFFTSGVQAQIGPIVLTPQKLITIPKEFYIAQITDERPEQKAVAWIYPAAINLKQKTGLQAVDLKGGGLAAIQDFIWQSLPSDKKLRPVLMHIKECRVTESLSAQNRVEGKVALSLSFDLLAGEGSIFLTNYRIDSKYTRPDNQINVPASMLSSSLNAALKYFNTWMDSQANNNPKLAREVKVTFKEYQQKQEGDTIYYAVNRPLRWDDFQDKPRGSKYAASVFPSFGFEEKTEIANGVISIKLEMKTFVPKSGCWVKDFSRDDYTLNHEQRHFDIVKIIEQRFEQKIRATPLSVLNYEGIINYQFYNYFGEMNHLQDQYDDETRHGLNTGEQERWNQRIDQELTALGIKAKNAS
ncbi:hypothetical protein [Mucilaginibacter arboris]|uniref:DUF922 domain-containing protein n=1 Tax=Mucilaginibacter arboris TaxID=2682090 RepID=A0A7K1T113_9SPHI|nr:hypothetical protein [Mucilaginibacter arboris]MVN23256.1 hypothetical protein [Mucilaginibacter arboris]